MVSRKRTWQQRPRDYKHLVIHHLLNIGCLVFSNIGAKDTVDLVVGVPKYGELRTTGIRIKNSSYNEKKKMVLF